MWWIPGCIDNSRVGFLYLSWKGVLGQLQRVASGIHSTVLGVKTEWFLSWGPEHIFDSIVCWLIPDSKGRLAGGLDSWVWSAIVLLPPFMFLEVRVEVLSCNRLIAYYTVDSIDGPFHIARKWTIGNSIIGRSGFKVGGVAPYLWGLGGISCVRWRIYMVILSNIVGWWVGGNWWVAREHGLGRWVIVGWIVVAGGEAGLRVDDRYFWFSREGWKWLYILGDAQSYLSTLQVNVDLKIEGVLRGRGESLVR